MKANITRESLVNQVLGGMLLTDATEAVREFREFAREHGGEHGDDLYRVAGQPVLPGVDYGPLALAVWVEADHRQALSDPAWPAWHAWSVSLLLAMLAISIAEGL